MPSVLVKDPSGLICQEKTLAAKNSAGVHICKIVTKMQKMKSFGVKEEGGVRESLKICPFVDVERVKSPKAGSKKPFQRRFRAFVLHCTTAWGGKQLPLHANRKMMERTPQTLADPTTGIPHALQSPDLEG